MLSVSAALRAAFVVRFAMSKPEISSSGVASTGMVSSLIFLGPETLIHPAKLPSLGLQELAHHPLLSSCCKSIMGPKPMPGGGSANSRGWQVLLGC